jgi:hypothetical protein
VWTATGVVTAGAIGLAGAAPAAAHGHHHSEDDRTVVDGQDNSRALRTAIAGAAAGHKLLVKGTCIGPFTIWRAL